MTKIVLLQSRTTPLRVERERENFTRAIGGRAEVDFLSALDTKLAWTYPDKLLGEYDGLILGGSSDLDFHGGRDEKDPVRLVSYIILSRVRNILSYALAQEFPLLGICYGHQLLGQMRGGRVRNDQGEARFGSYQTTLTDEGKKDALFGTFPQTFYAQYHHKDSVTRLPEGATHLGSAAHCRYSILRYGPKAYSVQFHPEVERLSYVGDYEHHDSPEASELIPRWIERIVEGRLTPRKNAR